MGPLSSAAGCTLLRVNLKEPSIQAGYVIAPKGRGFPFRLMLAFALFLPALAIAVAELDSTETLKDLTRLFIRQEAGATYRNAIDIVENGDFDTESESQKYQIGLVPDSIREFSSDDPFVTSVLGPLGVLELLSPQAAQRTLQPHSFNKEAVLDDSLTRINKNFKIPAGLRDRVAFWFDIYTKYDSNQRVIHHSQYPWVVFKIVDTSFIIESDSPRVLWLRREKADKFVKTEAARIEAILKKIASAKSLSKLSEQEQDVADALSVIGGNVRKQARLAISKVRVQTGQRNFFMDGLEISSRYLPTMEKIFIDRGLPAELTRIPFVESSFNKTATSKVGACGIWQFMNETGRKFMQVDDLIDERRSPLKSTEAAARLLKESHLILYRSWPLAVTAWNHGPSGVRRAAQASGSRELDKIVGRYRSRTFDFASSNFYSEFLAALYAEKYSDLIFGRRELAPDSNLHSVKLARAVRFNDLLSSSGLTQTEFLAANPDLETVAKRNLVVPRGFKLHLPSNSLVGLERYLAQERHRLGPAKDS